jgi:tight adherence protein C
VSDLYVPLALIGTFSAVAVAVVAVDAHLVERRRAVELLRAQVREIPSSNLRDQEMAEPFASRVLLPFVGALGRIARRITPIGMRDRIARQLVLAGNPAGWDAEKVAATKIFGCIGGGVLGVALALLAGLKGFLPWGGGAFFAAFGYLVPGAGLGQKAVGRQEAIRLAMPDTMDLLTISVEAGLGFDAALAHVTRNVPGPLSDEISRMLQEIQLGVPRQQAFRQLGERTDVDELRAFVLAMVQADIFGISIAKVLRAQSKELRTKRRQRAEEKAMKVPVKLLFPLIFCILPSMFVAILGPGIIRILENLFGIKP